MKKSFISILVIFCFSLSLFAEPITYSFSGFGGGLPSSASVFKAGADSSDTATSTKIIIEDDEDTDDDEYTNDDYYNDEPTVKKEKKTAAVLTGVAVGLVAVAGIVGLTFYFKNSSSECCAQFTDGAIEGCGKGCGESCGEACTKSITDSCSDACAESMAESCSSSTSNITCTTSSIGAMFENGFQIIPVFIP
ncbi:MAG: hypothetical protein K5907_04640 [Treponema sp.]|nr:hypothetical protein [Treponema sp.]